MRWKRALGKDVVNTESAETTGAVDGLVVDPETSKVVAMVVGDKVVSWTDAEGIGRDAVTITKTAMIRDADAELEQRAIAGAGDPIGKTVITEDGVAMGSIADVEFDPETGALGCLVLADDEISGRRLMGIGSYAVVVSSGARAASSGGGLDTLSKAELYEKAKERDLDGRSSMTKKELLAALS